MKVTSFPKVSGKMKSSCSFIRKTGTLLFLFLILSFSNTFATHYRYGNISWSRTDDVTRTVKFTTSMAFRKTFYTGVSVGATINSGYTFYFGDGTTAPISLLVTSVNAADDWFYGTYTVSKTYTGSVTSYTAGYASNARLSNLVNNPDGAFSSQTIVKLVSGNLSSPISTMPPIIYLATNIAANSFQISAYDPDGSTLAYSLATPNEVGAGVFGGSGAYVQPAGLTVNGTTGLVSFSTVGKAVGLMYTAAITITDGTGSKTIVDFIIKIVATSNPPTYDYAVTPVNSTVYSINPGQALHFNVKAIDSDLGDIVNLSVVGLTTGMTFSPNLPATGNPVLTGFSWTPTSGQLGVYILNFSAQDIVGTQTNTSVIINVNVNPIFISPTPAFGSDRLVLNGTTTTDIISATNPNPSVNTRLLSASIPAGAILSPSLPTTLSATATATMQWTPSSSDFGVNTFNYVAKDENNKTATHQYDLIVNTIPVFTSTPVLSVFAGQPYIYNITAVDPDVPYGDVLEILGGSIPAWLTYVDNGNGTATLSGTPSVADGGDYNITLEAEDLYHHSNPAHSEQSFIITVIPCNVSANISSSVNVSCNGGNNGSVDLVVTGATAPVNYSWSNGATSEDLSGVVAGAYVVNILDANGCTASTNVTIAEPGVLVASSTSGSIACNGGATTVDVTATGGTAPYSGTGSFTVGAGNYSYTVTDANGCSSITTISISEPTLLVASSTSGSIACNGGTTTVDVTATGGTAPYSGTGSFTVGAGNYSYTVTDANGCTSVTTITVAQPTLLVADAGTAQTVYYGYTPSSCATLNASATGGAAPYTYSWNTGATTASIIACPSVSTIYTVTVKDANGCESLDQVKVCSIDVRCEKGGKAIVYYDGGKVLVCHVPDGDISKKITLCVAPDAIPEHLAHGDKLGICGEDQSCTSQNRAVVKEEQGFDFSQEMGLKPYPSPFTDETTVRFYSSEATTLTVNVYNVLGVKVASLFNGEVKGGEMREEKFKASDLTHGIYLVRMMNSKGEIKTERVVLTR